MTKRIYLRIEVLLLRMSSSQDDRTLQDEVVVVVAQDEQQAKMANGCTAGCGYQDVFMD
jgi:hypothetical protein